METNSEQQDIHLIISDNHLIEWNSSRQIGGWVDTQYISPAIFWIRTYKLERKIANNGNDELTTNESLSISLHTESIMPDGVHGELSLMQTYEYQNRVHIIARDGWRIRNETANSERLRNS